MRIAALVIYQVVTLCEGNISSVDGPGLCSKVLGLLNCPAPLTSVPVHPEHRVTGCGETTVAIGEELCRLVSCHPSLRTADSLVVAGDGCASRWPSTTIREQFLLTVLENCSFFAHLVLRCVREGDRSSHDMAAPRGVIQRRTQPVTRSYAQRELEDLPDDARETSFPELETLWAEVASRHVRIAVSEGGTP